MAKSRRDRSAVSSLSLSLTSLSEDEKNRDKRESNNNYHHLKEDSEILNGLI